MKSYLSLVPIYTRVHRAQSRMTRFCIVLSVFLVVCIFGMADMEMRSQRIQTERHDGAWHVLFSSVTSEQSALIASRPEVSAASRYGVLNYALDEDYHVGAESAVVCGIDDGFLDIMPAAALTEGAFPKSGEALLTQGAKDRLSLSVGDAIALSLPGGGELSLTVSGFSANTSMLTQYDALGVLLNMEDFGALCESLSLPSQGGTLYVRFSSTLGIRAAIEAICESLSIPAENAHENTKLLGILGQSSDSYMLQLYGTAAVLAALVVIAGAMMIGSSLNASIMQRTEFFGLLRCLGASCAQVRRYVRMEALSWCVLAIPMGVGAAVIVTWGMCALLRLLSPGYFEAMPAFGISPIAIAAGIVLGLVTVLSAARRPAKRASSVSPLTALGGCAPEVSGAKRAYRASLPVEYALGVRHAARNRRNILLMTGSFALSIVLFLAFSTAIDFMQHAIRPLKPYTPDISIVSADSSCSIPLSALEELSASGAVKRAYGRMFAYGVPVWVNGAQVRINLISYESNQFKWARSSLLSGSVEQAVSGGGVMTVFDSGNPIALGDTLTGDFGAGEAELEVCALLSDSPFAREAGVETVICSEDVFRALTGSSGYTIIDIQLNGRATDDDVEAIRRLAPEGTSFSDRRMSNNEVRGAFYSMSVFMYGFLCIIALIAAFNIVNSMALSVSARTRQYGAMRAIGMSDGQLRAMLLSEAVTYALSGIVIGCLAGLPVNRLLFGMLVTSHWGDAWSFPTLSLMAIVLVVSLSALASVRGPLQRISALSIVDTIHSN